MTRAMRVSRQNLRISTSIIAVSGRIRGFGASVTDGLADAVNRLRSAQTICARVPPRECVATILAIGIHCVVSNLMGDRHCSRRGGPSIPIGSLHKHLARRRRIGACASTFGRCCVVDDAHVIMASQRRLVDLVTTTRTSHLNTIITAIKPSARRTDVTDERTTPRASSTVSTKLV